MTLEGMQVLIVLELINLGKITFIPSVYAAYSHTLHRIHRKGNGCMQSIENICANDGESILMYSILKNIKSINAA